MFDDESELLGVKIYDEQTPSNGPDLSGSPRITFDRDDAEMTCHIRHRTNRAGYVWSNGIEVELSVRTREPPFDTWDAQTASPITAVIDFETANDVMRLIVLATVEQLEVEHHDEMQAVDIDTELLGVTDARYSFTYDQYRSLESVMSDWHAPDEPEPYPDAIIAGDAIPACPDCGTSAWAEADHDYATYACANCSYNPLEPLSDALDEYVD